MQVSSKLRRADGGHAHWCPGCHEMHTLPNGWTFVNGDLEKPSFLPSFKHEGLQTVKVDGKWTGEWVLDAHGKPIPSICHYVLTDGILYFCADCTHALVGQAVPLPELPEPMRDVP